MRRPSTGPRRGAALVAPILLAALGAASLRPLWSGGGIVASAHSDVLNSVVGLASIEKASLAEGRWPLWDPTNNAGQPAHAFPVAQYTSPVYWAFLLLPVERAVNTVFLAYALLSGWGMYALARRLTRTPHAAFFAGAAYMLSYRALCVLDAGWPWAMAAYAWTPWLFWALERLIEEPSRERVAEGGLLLALALIGGYPQLLYYALLALTARLAWRLPAEPPARRRALAAAAAGVVALAALLAAPDLLPRAQFSSYSTRLWRDYGFFLGRAPSWSDLRALLWPADDGGARLEYWENAFYLGAWLYPLALYAAWTERRRRPLLAGLVLLLAVGFDTPLLRALFRFLPGFAWFRFPSRAVQLAQVPVVLLAAAGADRLLDGPWRRRAALATALLCVPVLADFGLRAGRLKAVPLSDLLPPLAFPEVTRDRPDAGRLAAIGRSVVHYGLAPYYGVDMIEGNEPLNLRWFVEYLFVLQAGDPRLMPRGPAEWTDLRRITKPELLRALDVRWIAANEPVPLEGLGWRLAGRRDDVPVFKYYAGVTRKPMYLWRDERPLGPAYFATAVRPSSDEAESLASLAAASSPREARVFGWTGEALDPGGGTVRRTRNGWSSSSYEVDSRGRDFLILSQVWFPDWRATLDGVRVPLYRTNHALTGLVVPPGRHRLELEMTSPLLDAGLALCLLGLALAASLRFSARAGRQPAAGAGGEALSASSMSDA